MHLHIFFIFSKCLSLEIRLPVLPLCNTLSYISSLPHFRGKYTDAVRSSMYGYPCTLGKVFLAKSQERCSVLLRKVLRVPKVWSNSFATTRDHNTMVVLYLENGHSWNNIKQLKYTQLMQWIKQSFLVSYSSMRLNYLP